MSSILSHIEENPQETQRLIGLGYPELQQLIQNAELLHNEKQAVLESQKTRITAGGGGRKSIMSVQEQIILTFLGLCCLNITVQAMEVVLIRTNNCYYPPILYRLLHFSY